MSEKEGGDSRFLTGFLLGFLAGVLIALGVGMSFVMIGGRREAMHARMAMLEAEEARAVAEAELARAEEHARQAKMQEDKARDALEKVRADQKAEPDKVQLARQALRDLEAAVQGLRDLEAAAEAYKVRNGEYPENLEALTEQENGKPAA